MKMTYGFLSSGMRVACFDNLGITDETLVAVREELSNFVSQHDLGLETPFPGLYILPIKVIEFTLFTPALIKFHTVLDFSELQITQQKL